MITAEIPGTPLLERTLTPGNETDVYWFDAVAGERFYFDRVSFSGGYYTDWQLLDPAGNTLWGPTHMYSNDVDVTTLPRSGSRGSWAMVMDRVNSTSKDGRALTASGYRAAGRWGNAATRCLRPNWWTP